ncbi:patatin-like phospholipase family protein [Micavibrio aeruginosavorus]|uniref:Patatin-like phospholipase family protein n=1 Tax=Micavibrio aeruginosavorus (strain ARL-13) TaxID=856793 RepID=G2KPU9_MICAA|nr:patatin-like phospholipase family protein [Micavibrio aeruginosavorus]AEP09918.1 patatin-like phospholipase family protein [Micavibrio aeruginosavorus ARL-13]
MSNRDNTDHQEPQDYVLYVPGGVLWGIYPLVVLKFLEDLTQLPVSKQFNNFAGSSTGAVALGGLNIPKSKGSTEPRYSAADALEFYKVVGRRTFPPRSAYYERQLIMDLVKLGHEFTREIVWMAFEKTDALLSAGVNGAGRLMNRLKRSTTPYEPFILKPMRFLHNTLIRPVDNAVERGINHLLAKSRYDINVLREALDTAYRFEDTNEPVKLNETIVSHHVTSMNVTRNEPAIFFHFKDETGTTRHVSHPDMDIVDLTCASSAAQTIFQLYKASNENHYCDIAHFDTPQTPINSYQGRMQKNKNIKLIMIGTAKRDAEIDVQRLNGMLFLQQLIGRLGAHLLGLPQRFILQRDLMNLRQNLGADNVVVIDKSMSKDTLRGQVLSNPRLINAAAHFGVDLRARSQISHQDRTPSPDLFDSRDDNIEKMESFGWDMVWENIDTLVPLAKELVENAALRGHITNDRASEIIRGIDKIYPMNESAMAHDHDNDNTPAPEPSKPSKWLQFDERAPTTLRQSITGLFNRIVQRDKYTPPPPPAAPYIRDRDSFAPHQDAGSCNVCASGNIDPKKQRPPCTHKGPEPK